MKQYDAPPAMTIDPEKSYTAAFTLEKGVSSSSSFSPKRPR